MTLTQLGAFVLVARLGSVRRAADALSISEPAVSQALRSLRARLGDPLVTRGETGMVLTAGGARLLPVASQMVSLGAEAEGAVRAARGAAEQLRVVATSTLAEFVAAPLAEAFGAATGNAVETSTGVARDAEMAVLLANRLTDVSLGPRVSGPAALHLHSEPVFRARLVAVAAAERAPDASAGRWRWLVDAAGTDEATDTSQLLRRLGVPEERIRVFPSQTAAWEAAAAGHGVAIATAHLVGGRLRRRELRVVETPATPMASDWYVTSLDPEHRAPAAGSFRQFLGTARAMAQMREPGAGVPPSKFRPPVHVTIWA